MNIGFFGSFPSSVDLIGCCFRPTLSIALHIWSYSPLIAPQLPPDWLKMSWVLFIILHLDWCNRITTILYIAVIDFSRPWLRDFINQLSVSLTKLGNFGDKIWFGFLRIPHSSEAPIQHGAPKSEKEKNQIGKIFSGFYGSVLGRFWVGVWFLGFGFMQYKILINFNIPFRSVQDVHWPCRFPAAMCSWWRYSSSSTSFHPKALDWFSLPGFDQN